MKNSIRFVVVPMIAVAGGLAAVRAQDNPLAGALKASYEAETRQDYAAAAKALAIPAAANSYLAQLRLGWLGYCEQNWTESISHYKQAAQIDPFAIEPLLGLMLPQMAAGHNDDALRTAQAVLRKDPNNYTALSRTAWLAFQRQDYRESAITYRKLVSFYPTDTEMLLGLGFSLKYSGDKKEAAKCFNAVLLLSPENSRAQEGLREEPARPAGGGGGLRPPGGGGGNGMRTEPPPGGGPRGGGGGGPRGGR